MNNKLKWGILSTGRIASVFVNQIANSKNHVVSAVASRDKTKSDKFAKEHNIPIAYPNYDEMLEDKNIDVIYIATPHPMHAKWTIKAADNGKHILCEKPFTLNYREALEVIDIVKKRNVFCMEAFHYRCHPQTLKILEILNSGVIGEIKIVNTNFSFDFLYDLKHRILNHNLGGGGILDVGCYCVSMVRLIAGNKSGVKFIEPADIKGFGYIGTESRVDEYASGIMKFSNGIISSVSCGCKLNQKNEVFIYGTKGYINIPMPWIGTSNNNPLKINVFKNESKNTEEIIIIPSKGLFEVEADEVFSCIKNGEKESQFMSYNDTLGNMKVLDEWRKSIGMIYDMEK